MVTDLLRRLLGVAILLAASGALGGCGTLYVAQAAHGELELLAARRPIDRVVADPHTAAPVRTKLETARAIRRFAVEALDLPDNASYRSYADLHRPYVVWNVVATPEFSVEPLRWCFPIAGCVTYRGYFKQARAQAFAQRLHARGDDVHVDGVPAYSTLGRFADPILNTMLSYSDADLAAVIFHELAHQVLYVPGDSQFNEAFAMTVEDAGLARWLESLGRAGELARFEARHREERACIGIFVRGRAGLRALYSESLPIATRRARKQQTLGAIAAQMRDYEHAQRVDCGYDEWLDAGLNNAELASVGTYYDCRPAFDRLLATERGDLPRFYAAVRKLARGPRAGRHAFCAAPAMG